MKPSIVACVLMVSVMLVASSFTADKLQFRVRMQGIENRDLLSAAVAPAELSVLTIETADEEVRITRFELILARGKSPVERASAEGNTFDLSAYKTVAKAGDRVVIEVKKISGREKEVTGKERILTIPVR